MTSNGNDDRERPVGAGDAAGADRGQGPADHVLEHNVGLLLAQAERMSAVDEATRTRLRAGLMEARQFADGRVRAVAEPVRDDGARAVAQHTAGAGMARWWLLGLAASLLLVMGGGLLWMRSRRSVPAPTNGSRGRTPVASLDGPVGRKMAARRSQAMLAPTDGTGPGGVAPVVSWIGIWTRGVMRGLVERAERAMRLFIAVLSKVDRVRESVAKRRMRGHGQIPRKTTPPENAAVNALDGL